MMYLHCSYEWIWMLWNIPVTFVLWLQGQIHKTLLRLKAYVCTTAEKTLYWCQIETSAAHILCSICYTWVMWTRLECYSWRWSDGMLLNRHWSSPRSSSVFSPALLLAGNQRSLLPISRLIHLSALSSPPECFATHNPLCSLVCGLRRRCQLLVSQPTSRVKVLVSL